MKTNILVVYVTHYYKRKQKQTNKQQWQQKRIKTKQQQNRIPFQTVLGWFFPFSLLDFSRHIEWNESPKSTTKEKNLKNCKTLSLFQEKVF